MAESQPKNEPKSDAAGAGGGGGSKLPLILMGANSLMLAGVLAVLILRPTGPARAPKEAPADHPEAPKVEAPADKKADKANLPGPTVKFPDFVVHLRDPDVDRYARLAIEVEVQDDKAKEGLTARLPQVRDSFIAYLSDRTTGDLRGSEAIAKAKGDLAERLKAVAPGLPVRGLYMTELVVQ
jgi:flagellar FliL protein